MNKLLKRVLATLSCAVLIGQIMLTSVVGAAEELLDESQITIPVGISTSNTTDGGDAGDSDISNRNTNSDSDFEAKTTNNTGNESDDNGPGAGDIDNPGFETGNGDSNGDNDGPGAGDINNPGYEDGNGDGKTTSEQCDNIKSTFMNDLSDIINDIIRNPEVNSSGFLSAEASIDDDAIILYVKNEDVELPDLSNYRNSMVNYILGNGGDSFIDKIWPKLVAEGFEINITNVVNLVNIDLGSNRVFINFNKLGETCSFSFLLKLKVDASNSSGNNRGLGNNGDNQRSNNIKLTFMNSLSNVINDIIKDSEIDSSGFLGVNASNFDGNNGSLGSNNGDNQCNNDIKLTFMNSLSDIINNIINNLNNNDFKRAEVSVDDDAIVLYVDNENVKLPDLSDYRNSMLNYILGNGGDSFIDKIWPKLVAEGFEINITNVVNSVNIDLGSNKVTINFNKGGETCSFSFFLKLKVDDSNPGGNNGNGGDDNGDNQCNSEIKLAFMNSLSNIINDIIKNPEINSSGFLSAEASIDDDAIVLHVDNENVKLPDLSSYRNSMLNYILGNGGDGFIDKIWPKLVAEGFEINITNVVNSVNIDLGSNKVTINFNKGGETCSFSFLLKLKVDASNSGGNNGNGYSGGGSRGGSDSSNSNDNDSNDGELALSGEVADEVMEVKKAESCSIEGSTYSDEENQAYLWACEKGIVIADNIMKADMGKNLTRAELAKMMSVYSEELLGRTRIKNKGVIYPDVDSSLGDLEYYVQEGYRLQIMGIHADGSALSKFSPNSLVTRGEFGTVFSRVLHGNIYNIGNSHYYEKHLDVLKNEGILKNTNPKLIEKRGWILLMLYRSQKVEESNGNISNEEIVNITGEKEEAKNETGENVAEVETGNNSETSGN